jgi:hypothetical protein
MADRHNFIKVDVCFQESHEIHRGWVWQGWRNSLTVLARPSGRCHRPVRSVIQIPDRLEVGL